MDNGLNKISMGLFPIYMGDVKPHYTLQKAFEKHFDCFTYDWVNIAKSKGLPRTQLAFIELLKERRPEYCFMQLQNPINMTVPVIREMAKYTKIINWSGDIRQTKQWYDWFEAIGKEIYLTLFSNNTDVDIMRERGVRADYLQVGFDTAWYNRNVKKVPAPEIVYCANNYGTFQLSEYRAEVAVALKKHFSDRFGMFGSGWAKYGLKTYSINNPRESEMYNNCKIAISVSNFQFKRYYSDRLLRIMGCGALPMSHEFEEMELDFQEGHNIVTFKNTFDLIAKCEYYLSDHIERKRIGNNAYQKAHSDCTWDNRCIELFELLNKYAHSGKVEKDEFIDDIAVV